MSALGQKQTWGSELVMSALPPKADITAAQTNVRFVPKADIWTKLLIQYFASNLASAVGQ